MSIETQDRGSEAAVLVGLVEQGHGAEVLDELARLLDTAGATEAARLVQARGRAHPATLLGSGKVQEVGEAVRATGAGMVCVDAELSPHQIRNLEGAVGVRVVDRTELILDIFATHAQSHQARLAVELAQMRYLRPRLQRMWTHLERERLEGAIGTRGPGETQLESDRRIVDRKIQKLGERLAAVEARKVREVRARSGQFQASLVGYTNAGKSTLLNALTGADALVKDRLFATLDTLTRKWVLPSGRPCLLSDTVGFIRGLPHHLVASFHATLEEARNADLLLVVIDAADLEAPDQLRSVHETLAELEAEAPRIGVMNQVDRMEDRADLGLLRGVFDETVAVSGVTGEGLAELAALVDARMGVAHPVLRVRIPAADGRLLADVRASGQVREETWEEEEWLAEVVCSPELAGRLRAAGAVEPSTAEED